MDSSLITNSCPPPFLSVPNFSSFSIVCALPPSLPPSYSSAIQPLRCPPWSLNLSLTCFICPSPAVLRVPTLLLFFFVSAGPSRPRAGIWLATVDRKRANSSEQASAWKQGPGGEDKRMAGTPRPDRVRQKLIVGRIAIFNSVAEFWGGCLGKNHP